MPFNTALSGIRAASKDLSVTGNNIANASTTGFKSSRAEFGDLYASSVLGSGANATGNGVRLQDVAQNFKEGNVSFTESNLDMAINGSGFFMLNLDGEQVYSRAGTFGLDDEGHIVNNAGGRLQGFSADAAGNVSGLRGDLRIETSNLAPRQTTNVESVLNLDSSEPVLQTEGTLLQTTGDAIGLAQIDTEGVVTNGYPVQEIDVVDPDGNAVTYSSAAGASAARTASELNALAGVSATASSSMGISGTPNGQITVNLNGVDITASNLDDLGQQINNLSSSSLPGISSSYDSVSGELTVLSSVGHDLKVALSSTDPADTLQISGNGGSSETIQSDDGNAVVVGGTLEILLDDNYTATNANPANTGLFGDLTDPNAFEAVVVNAFDPNDQSTYNSATSMNIFDSLGNPHVMTQFFVRQDYDPNDPTTSRNHWQMHVQVDGENVGDPDTTLAPPLNTEPTMATFDIYFNSDGSLDTDRSEDFLISNWTPRDSNGEANGSMGPQNVLAGGSMVMPDPPTSSNFVLDLGGTTQFNDDFSEYSVNQNGYTTGRLSSLNIDDEGLISARFTNGESQTLGQITLAKFTNEQGLSPMGDTMWNASSESGQPSVGVPGSSDLGAIQSGALEESNVDLSEQLVNLIVAQRNFQASAKTIETADQTTQTIINLR